MYWPRLTPVLSAGMVLLLLVTFTASSAFVLTKRSELLVERRNQDLLISPKKTFSCGFYQVGDNAFTFSIWFSQANVTNNNDPFPSSRADVVWSANRDHPVNGRRSRVSLQGKTFLVLTDGYDNSVVWTTTGSSNGGQASSNKAIAVERVELLDSGNLVLRAVDGNIMWQSFDFPTDTILPGQPFTRNTRLISSVSTSSLSTGFYMFYFDNDNVLRLMYDGKIDITSIYWPDPEKMVWDNDRTTYNSSRYALLGHAGQFTSSDGLEFNASDYDLHIPAVRRRLTLDPDGNLRLYSYGNYNYNDNIKMNGWYVTWQAMMHKGKIHGTCGRNGIFTYKSKPTCSCPPGYSRVNPTSWKDGCHPDFRTVSGDSKNHHYFCPSNGNDSYKFVEVPYTDFYGSDVNFTKALSLNTCRNICEQNCRCQGFVYRQTGQGNCYPKFALFNGYTSPDFISTLFLKFPKDFPVSHHNINFFTNNYSMAAKERLACSLAKPTTLNYTATIFIGTSTTSRFKWVYGYSFVVAFGLIELLFIATGWWFLYHESHDSRVCSLELASQGSGQHYKHVVSNNFRMFSYHELKRATNNFKHLLGKGGSGEVYKGVLEDKTVVAVKRLPNAEKGSQGEAEFRAELSVIGSINHMNLVRMWGFCVRSSQRILIYEYVENGSLDKSLFPLYEDYTDIYNSTGSNVGSDITCTSTSSGSLLHRENVLNWSKRFEIALGMARGLAYLHHECLDWIIHCDIKPENILLDADYHPKIADFGLVKLTQRDSPGSHLSMIRGTKGYMAPEWTSNVPITTKVDVYSYGVILLELLRGARLTTCGVLQHPAPSYRDVVQKPLELRGLIQVLKQGLVCNIDGQQEEGYRLPFSTIIEEFLDPRLHGDFHQGQARVLLEVALSCLEEDRHKRPTMDYVVQLLNACCDIGSRSAKFDHELKHAIP